MKLNVLLSPLSADELYFTNKTTVVIDVLRATTTIITALANGAKDIVPVVSVEFAVKISGSMFGGQTLLGGERNTKKIDGFSLGNSPLEYTKNAIARKSIVFYSTNGSKAIVKAKFSENLFLSSFINLKAVAKHLVKLGKNTEILCAGENNNFSLEDSVCAGDLINEIKKLKKDAELSDSAKGAIALYKSFGKDVLSMLKESEHGKLLISNDFTADLEYCSQHSITDVIPFYSGSVLKAVS